MEVMRIQVQVEVMSRIENVNVFHYFYFGILLQEIQTTWRKRTLTKQIYVLLKGSCDNFV